GGLARRGARRAGPLARPGPRARPARSRDVASRAQPPGAFRVSIVDCELCGTPLRSETVLVAFSATKDCFVPLCSDCAHSDDLAFDAPRWAVDVATGGRL